MKIISAAISGLAKWKAGELNHFIENPAETQRNVLQHLVAQAQSTEFGRKYKFHSTFRIKQFKQLIPICEYNQIKFDIERMMKGEQNVLWNTPVEWYAKSSGTTSDRSKFLPVSKEMLRENHFQANKDLLYLYHLHYPETELLKGKGLIIGGSHQISEYQKDIFYGDLSAVLLQNSPFWGHWIRTPELSVALMEDWDKKIEALAYATLTENVTSVSGVPTWTLMLLHRILEITGKQNIQEIWPNLELYFHGGVSFVPYRKQFEQLFAPQVRCLEIYNASEGFFAAQTRPEDEGMLLFTNHGIFYEFMPVDQYGTDDPQTIGLNEVELGKHYAPVISTAGGLWRYIIGDTIQFVSKKPYMVKVSGRLKLYINAFGEEVIIENTDNAIAAASSKLNCSAMDYTVCPVFIDQGLQGRHQWLIEFDVPPQDIHQFENILDDELRQINSDYDAKRFKDIALTQLEIINLPTGTFSKWLKQKGKMGGQHKVPRLSNDRKIVDEILQII